MTLETLKERIEQFIQLDEELEQAVRKYRASDSGGFFQADAVTIAKYAKENGLRAEIKPRDCDTYPWMVTVPEIKMCGVASDEKVQEIKALLDAEGLECTGQATKSRK